MNDEIFSDGLIGDLCHHAVNCLTAQLVKIRVCLDFFKAYCDHFHDILHLANVVWHQGHVD